jgi:hypothetical protein
MNGEASPRLRAIAQELGGLRTKLQLVNGERRALGRRLSELAEEWRRELVQLERQGAPIQPDEGALLDVLEP